MKRLWSEEISVSRDDSHRQSRFALLPHFDLGFAQQLESLLRLRITRNVLCLQLLCASATYPQRTSTSFGPMIDLSLGYTPHGIVRSPFSSQVAVLAQETPTVYFYSLSSTGSFIQADLLSLSEHCSDIVAHPHTAKGQDELALLSTDGTTALLVRKVDTVFSETALELRTSSQRIAYGDINNDKKLDLLFFGRKRAGMSSLIMRSDGRYSGSSLLFPDLSISDLQCADLNGDGITDIFVLNWLTNQLALFYGIGRGVFSEQVEVTLPGEPDVIAISPVTKERTLRIAVSIPEEKLVATFICNAMGEIEPTGKLKLPSSPSHVQFAAINGDQYFDIVVTTDQAVYIFLGEANLQFAPPASFGTGNGTLACEVADLDGDLKTDLVLIDRETRRLVAYGNANWSGSVEWPATYGVGVGPRGIAVLDVNGDGLLDVAVPNSVSSTLSILLNRGKGRFEGQQAIPIGEKPVSAKALRWLPGLERTILTTHASVEKISIVGFNGSMNATSISAIPTGSNPYIVFAKQDSILGQLEILARHGSSKDGSLSLSLFRQISGGQFLEKSLRASLPGRITSLTVDEYSGLGKYELVFVTHDRATKQSMLSIAFSTQGFDFKTVKPLFSFPDSTAGVRSILSGYVDDDAYKDLVLFMSAPRNAFGLVYGKGGEAFRDSLDIIHGAQPLNEDAVLLRDVNSDGHIDLTWIDVGRNAVVTAYGRGHRKFDLPVSLCSASGITAIQIAAMRVPTIQDLILTNGLKGTLTIMFDPFR
jgi:hypothetical protein